MQILSALPVFDLTTFHSDTADDTNHCYAVPEVAVDYYTDLPIQFPHFGPESILKYAH